MRGGTGSRQLLARGEICLGIEEMDAEHEENWNTSLSTGFDRRAWSEDFRRQGSEGQSGEGWRQEKDATDCHLGAPVEQRLSGREVYT